MTQPISNSVHTSSIAQARPPRPEAARDTFSDRGAAPTGSLAQAFVDATAASAEIGRAAALAVVDPVRDTWDGAIDVGEAIGGLSSGLRFDQVFGDGPADRLRPLSPQERFDLAARGAVKMTTAFVEASAKGVFRMGSVAVDFVEAYTAPERSPADAPAVSTP